MIFVAMGGLPRTGSTLMSAILDQNPMIHAEGNSPVCQLMWDSQWSCRNASEQLAANYRFGTQDALVRAVPRTYYEEVAAEIVVDKCRSWTLPDNMEMLRRYFDHPARVIVMTRPVDEIINSFEQLWAANNVSRNVDDLLVPGSEPIMRSLDGIAYAKTQDTGEFHFVEYADFIANPKDTLDGIYDFIGVPRFDHDFDNVVNNYPENDHIYGLVGQHDIRRKVGAK